MYIAFRSVELASFSLRMCSINSKNVGTIDKDISIFEYELKSPNTCIRCINYGATILSIVHTKNDINEEITLNYRSFEELYQNRNDIPYYGCIVGRVANRTNKGKFVYDDKEYSLAVNNGENHLHGGLVGYDKVVWNSTILGNDANNEIDNNEDSVGVCFTYCSEDGEEGYPGKLDIKVIYKLTIDDKFIIEYIATTDNATPINLTNHTYWNLSGNLQPKYQDTSQTSTDSNSNSKIYDHKLHLNCDFYLPVDKTQIPTEDISPVIDTHFDFSDPHGRHLKLDTIMTIDGGGMPGLDHCYVVNSYKDGNQDTNKDGNKDGNGSGKGNDKGKPLISTATAEMSRQTTLNQVEVEVPYVATLECDDRAMDVYSTQPGVQVYTANWLPDIPIQIEDTTNTNINSIHTQHNAICLECQHFPNAVNNKNLTSIRINKYIYTTSIEKSGILLPNEEFYHQTVYVFR